MIKILTAVPNRAQVMEQTFTPLPADSKAAAQKPSRLEETAKNFINGPIGVHSPKTKRATKWLRAASSPVDGPKVIIATKDGISARSNLRKGRGGKGKLRGRRPMVNASPPNTAPSARLLLFSLQPNLKGVSMLHL